MSTETATDRVQKGRVGEEAAAQYLGDHGYQVLARNQRTPLGELDLVCAHQGSIVVVEVKARSTRACGEAIEAVDRRKARRLRGATGWWLARRGLFPCPVRFDVVAVALDRDGTLRNLNHVVDILGAG